MEHLGNLCSLLITLLPCLCGPLVKRVVHVGDVLLIGGELLLALASLPCKVVQGGLTPPLAAEAT